jgi:hypothetical protein
MPDVRSVEDQAEAIWYASKHVKKINRTGQLTKGTRELRSLFPAKHQVPCETPSKNLSARAL